VVFCLISGFIGCGSAPKYAENSEVPWEVFYSVSTDRDSFVSNSRKLPNTFFIEVYIVDHAAYDSPPTILVSNTEQRSETRKIYFYMYEYVRKDFLQSLELEKKHRLQIEKRERGWFFVNVDGVSLNEIEAEIQAKRKADEDERQRIQAEEKLKKQEEDAKPRFSPEGKEYVKKNLLEVVGESKNQANRGKTLFFESSRIKITDTGVAGQYLVDQLISGIPFQTSGNVIMEYYSKIPANLGAALLGGYGHIILYRVEINQLGVATFKIDSFRE
jgi:hypothetical protein